MSKCFIVVGTAGTGKTTFVKNMLSKVNKKAVSVYDVNNEYPEYSKGNLPELDEFTNFVDNSRNGVFVFEEATIFFNTRGTDKTLNKILVRKRHTNNTIILVFHSLRAIPRYVYDLCNYMVVRKTNDSETQIMGKFSDEKLIKIMRLVNSDKNPYAEYIYKVY